MGKKPTSKWGLRANAAGLSQKDLADLTGTDFKTVSRGLHGNWKSGMPEYLVSLILAWEIMTPEQRVLWRAAIDQQREEERDQDIATKD